MEGSVDALEIPPRPVSQQIPIATLQEIPVYTEECSRNVRETSSQSEDISLTCIYRVPNRIRDVKPEAYTPRIVVIGPLHRSRKSTAMDGAETSSNMWYYLKKEYIGMENTKKRYLKSYTQRVGEETIEEMRKTIQAEEKNIRASYVESTEWIPSKDFVDLILQDSVFIMEFMRLERRTKVFKGDKNHSMESKKGVDVKEDLIMLENQLPYFIFDSLFSSTVEQFCVGQTVEQFILRFFRLKIWKKTNFKHFTDMFRCAYEQSLDDDIPRKMRASPRNWPPITELRNAEELSKAGVNFKTDDIVYFPEYKDYFTEEHNNDAITGLMRTIFKRTTGVRKVQPVRKRERVMGSSLHVEFDKGCLTMPVFIASEETDILLRNVIAYEQCVDVKPFTSKYIHFLKFLITSDRDVQLLAEKEVVRNFMGRPSLVVDMVKELNGGVNPGVSSQYHYIAKKLTAQCKSRRRRYWATLKNVYFSDLWTGTATIAAMLLLFFTLVGTVASVIQAYKSFK